MNSIENKECTSTRPALALVAKRTRYVLRNNLKVKIEAGTVRAVRLIAKADVSSKKTVRKELMAIVGAEFFDRNWTIQECFA